MECEKYHYIECLELGCLPTRRIEQLLQSKHASTITRLPARDTGETALFRATWNGKDEFVQLLLERGALVDKTDIWGRTFLMAACITRKESIARMLVDKGANCICTGQSAGTPCSKLS